MYFMIDIEADGPYPGRYSMISYGAIVVDKPLDKTSHGYLRPISKEWIPEALAVSGNTREETLKFGDPKMVMTLFSNWVKQVAGGERAMFVSDNNGFDWQFMNYYLWEFTGGNPFGHSSTNLGSLYKGFMKNTSKNFKHLRKTKHTHNPSDDARGNAEAMLEMIKLGLK